ncbi:MAG: hypothetical protein CUN54_05555 [Phototrophicales bacterium]|nr:MAG: hypothetical protein CUN54_05555 [Phototrophicales bacterium]
MKLRTTAFILFVFMMVLANSVFIGFAQEDGTTEQQDDTIITSTNAASLQELARFGRGEVFDLAYSADGTTIAVATTLGIWLYPANNLGTTTDPTLIASENSAGVITMSNDGQLLAFSDDRLIRIWNIASNAQVAILSIGGSARPRALAFSPDGTQLAVGYSDDMLRLWNVSNGALIGEIAAHNGDVNAVVFTPDGSTIVTGSQDETVKTWNAANGELGLTLAGHENDVNAIAVNSDGTLLASVSDDDTVRVWDLNTGTLLQTLTGHEHDVNAIAFAADGITIATGGEDEVIRLWNASTGVQQGIFPMEEQDILALAFSPDGEFIAAATNGSSSNGGVTLLSSSGVLQATTIGHADSMRVVAFNLDSSVLSFGNSDGILWMWNTSQPAQFAQIPAFEGAIAPEAHNVTQLAFATNGAYGVTTPGNDIRIIDPTTGQVLRILDPGFGFVESFAISPDSSLIAAVGSDGGVAIFDATTGQRLALLNAHRADVVSVAFSPDQRVIATASLDGTVRVWGVPGSGE